MRKVHFIQADVFSDSPFGGNPVVVVPDARGLSGDEMRSLARGMSFAETGFIAEPSLPAAAFALRCFSPTTELDYSGHQVLGASYVMASMGRLTLTGEVTRVSVQVGQDLAEVTLSQDASGEVQRVATADQPARFGRVVDDYGAIAAALSVEPREILQTGLPPQVVETGLSCLLVPVRGLATVREMLPLRQALDELLRSVGAVCALVFTRETLAPANDLHVRVFAPPLGVDEDPATGSANGALAAYLLRHGLYQARAGLALRSEQGSEMGRPSVVELAFAAGSPLTILVGGHVARSIEGSVFF